jgi:RNA polymerase sigma factor (sigma-70 family)
VHAVAPTFEAFFREHYDDVRRSLALALGNPLMAEELAQDAFTRALADWRRVSQMDRPAGWVYIVALRASRRRSKHRFAPQVESVDNAADDVARRVSIDEALSRLPERQRVALVLRYLADLPLSDVADAMGCAIGTVKSTLNTALARLGAAIDVEGWYAS